MPERWLQELRKLRRLEPRADLWDLVMLGPRRKPPRSHRTFRVVAPIAAALAVVVAVGALEVLRVFGPAVSQPGPGVQRHAVRFADPQFGWTIRVPNGLQLEHFHTTGMSGSDGVRVTNFPPDVQAANTGAPPMGWLRNFPSDGVAVQIWIGERFPVGIPQLHDSAFPLPRSSFHQVRAYVGGNEPHPWYRNFYGDGFGFAAAVWLGPRASRAHQQAAWAVMRSLRFPGLRQYTIWHDTYYVLDRVSRYPTGSVTTVRMSSLRGWRSSFGSRYPNGFYLIHAPRAFYVIDKVFRRPAKPFITCAVAFDAKVSEFFCPGTGLRWNRLGQPIRGPSGESGWQLALHIATVAQDGHVLFSPFWGGLLAVVLQGSPWA